MPTRRIDIFCTPGEIQNLLNIAIAYSNGKIISPIIENKNNKLKNIKNIVRNNRERWIVSCDIGMEDCNIFREDFVYILFPAFNDSGLMMGTIANKYIKDISIFPKKIFSSLSKCLKRDFMTGVWARNEIFGGERHYRNILISSQAIDWYNSGGRLLPQMGDGNVTYSPVERSI